MESLTFILRSLAVIGAAIVLAAGIILNDPIIIIGGVAASAFIAFVWREV